MPAYNFRKQFVPMILNGEKPHTIRRRRKRPTVKGDRLLLYTGMRTKGCELIAVTECVKVEPVVIYPFRHDIWIDKKSRWMSTDELNDLALRDGFENRSAFFSFFLRTYKKRVLDDFEIIWWDVDGMISGKAGEVRIFYGGV